MKRERAPTSPERLAALRTMAYADYLKTPEWIRRRFAHLQAVEYRCQVCNSPDELTVHHRTYERLGCEKYTDLLVLCWPCHKLFHERRKLAQPVSIQPQSIV
jgi:5-methylcytosine-specific restriction endonuclease McrA